jgi:hypothetical protein
LVLLTVAACTQPTTAITGRSTDTFITPTGTVTRPSDLSSTTIEAYFLGDDGSYHSYLGESPVAGMFEILDVPDGPFLLRAGDAWTSYDSHDVAISNTYIGRPDAVMSTSFGSAATKPTTLGLSAGALAPWSPADLLVADCWGNGTENWGLFGLDPPIGSGATSFEGAFPWSVPTGAGYSFEPDGFPTLMNADEGDALVVSRSTASIAGAATVETLTQLMNAPGVDQVNGGSAATGGTFADVAMTSQIEVAVDPSEFVATFGSGSASLSIGLITSPGASAGLVMGPDLVSIGEDPATTAVDVTLQYGDPFDPSWPVLVDASYYEAPVIRGLFLQANSVELIAVSASYTFHPAAVASSPMLDGTSLAGSDVTWDGASPLAFAVTLPDGASGFTLTLYDATDLDAEPSSFTVDGATVMLPPDVFVSGHAYAMQIGTSVSSTAYSSMVAGPFSVGP